MGSLLYGDVSVMSCPKLQNLVLNCCLVTVLLPIGSNANALILIIILINDNF